MFATAHYAYLHARVSAMAGRLLTPATLEEMMLQSEEQAAATFHGAALAGRESPSAETASSLEQKLIAFLLADFVILTRPLAGTAREFLLYWAHRFELSNLKAIIRGKMTGQTPAAIRGDLVDMGPFATLPVEELLHTEDAAELLRRLDGTPYAEIARQARQVFEDQHELFALDAAIDRRYFAGLSKHAGELRGADSRHIRELVGSIIDRVNLVWLLRYRYTYNLQPAQTYYLLIPAGCRLPGRRLLALSRLASFGEVMRALPAPLARLLQDAATASEATHILEQETWRIAESILKRTSFNLARALAYLILRERDLRQVRAILKGKQLNVPAALIRQAIGFPPTEITGTAAG